MAISVSGTLNGTPDHFAQGAWSVTDAARGAMLYFDGPLPNPPAEANGSHIEVKYKLVLEPTMILGKVCGAHLVEVIGYRR